MDNWTEIRAQEFDIAPQRENESESEFRHRVAEELRQQGCIVEAHEALTNRLYDDDNPQALTGIAGAVAKAVQGRDYPGSQVGSDIAAGTVAKHQRPNEAMLLLALLLDTAERKPR